MIKPSTYKPARKWGTCVVCRTQVPQHELPQERDLGEDAVLCGGCQRKHQVVT